MSRRVRASAGLAVLLPLLQACGPGPSATPAAAGGAAITRTEGEAISGAEGWRWIPFPDSTCTDAVSDPTRMLSDDPARRSASDP